MWHILVIIGSVLAGIIIVAIVAIIALTWVRGDFADSTGHGE